MFKDTSRERRVCLGIAIYRGSIGSFLFSSGRRNKRALKQKDIVGGGRGAALAAPTFGRRGGMVLRGAGVMVDELPGRR